MEKIKWIGCGYSREEGRDILTAELDRDGSTAVTGGICQGGSPSYCVCHGSSLYTVEELVGEAYIRRFEITREGGLLPTADRMQIPGGELCHLYAGERALFASCYGTGDFCAVDYGLTRLLWHRSARQVSRESGFDVPKELPVSHAHWVTEWKGILYLADLGRDRIYRYRMEEGLPAQELEAMRLAEGAGPRQVLSVGSKNRVLSVQELDSTICVWDYENAAAAGLPEENCAAAAAGLPEASHTAEAAGLPEANHTTAAPVCMQKLRTTAFAGENYPGTICMADACTVLVCNRGANTISAFALKEEGLSYIGEWATGNWPRYLVRVPETNLVINACNKEGVLVVFAWENNRLERRSQVYLPGASGIAILHETENISGEQRA